MKRIKTIISYGVAAAVPLAGLVLQTCNNKPKPNVIFILLDDFGYTDLACYGSRFYETPNIDHLAHQGVMFTNAYAACPVSSPTRAAIMTGKYPVRTGITDWIPGRQASNNGSPYDKLIALPFRQQLERDEITVAEMLRDNGYKTMISGKWHLGEDQQFWPENQGFDINKGGTGLAHPNMSGKANGYFSPYGNPRLEDGPDGEYLTDRQTDEAIRFIEENRTRPFFVYLSYYAVHNPMQAKEEQIAHFTHKADSLGLSKADPFTSDPDWIRPTMSDKFRERIIQSNPVYASMIYSVDENIGRLMSKLDELRLDKNTIIIFTSDNGGLATSEGSPTCNAPLRAGKGLLYEGGIRVPLIIKYPGKGEPGTVIHSPVSSIDYFSTIAEMTGSDAGKAEPDGISFTALFREDNLPERPLFWHYPHYSNQGGYPGSAVRLGKYKLIDNFVSGRQELYDLEADISETSDISSSNPGKTKELFDILKSWRKASDAKMMEPNPKWNGSSWHSSE